MPVAADRPAMTASSTAPKIIRLRYAGACVTCRAILPVKTEAVWDQAARVVCCVACSETPVAPVLSERSLSVAGASAQAEFERRHQKRDRRLEARWGALAGIAKTLSDDPQSTRSWAQGADLKRRTAADLGRLLGDRAVCLHDRKVGRANIDHLIVGASGVWIVDAKNYKGRVEHRSLGGWLGPVTWRIYVGDRDRSKLASGLKWQVEAVRDALAGHAAPVHPALCFPRKGWGWFAEPFRHEGVLVAWSERLAQVIDTPGVLEPEQIEDVAARLSIALGPVT